MRIGLISDVHWMTEQPASNDAWHGPGEYAGALDRVRLALEHFARGHVGVIALGGDLAHRGDLQSLTEALTACHGASAPVLVATGNHDISQSPHQLEQAHRAASDANLSLVTPTGMTCDGVRVAGVHVGEIQGWFRPRLSSLPSTAGWGEEPVVLLSHFPVLSFAAIIAENGLAYPGDLLDRQDLQAALTTRALPTIVIGGHIHARATRTEGPILQLTVGAMIEPPYECAVIEIDHTAPDKVIVRRDNIRLHGTSSPLDPVFSPVSEVWENAAGGWVEAR